MTQRKIVTVILLFVIAALIGVGEVGYTRFVKIQESPANQQNDVHGSSLLAPERQQAHINPISEVNSIQSLHEIIKDFFFDYNSCLPRLVAPQELKAGIYPGEHVYPEDYEYLKDIIICTHDAMKKFAKGLDTVNDSSDFIDSLRFGTCDRCSEVYR